jgi:NAD(P)-dependent dehydrogenase (short-subunit alcohol dehydrogenase family)
MNAPLRALILGIGSDIGMVMAERWLARGWTVGGTYRTNSAGLNKLAAAGCSLWHCDLVSADRVDTCVSALVAAGKPWDILVVAAGTMEPIGRFEDLHYADWQRGLEVNLLNPLRFVHGVLPLRDRRLGKIPTVIFFAGGGTNGAPTMYSSYTLSKIAAIKMTELLDREVTDSKFVIIGPGWVRTKIHEETLRAKRVAASSANETRRRLREDDFNGMENVIDCCDWAVQASRQAAGGRNFSVVHDCWGEARLDALLKADPNMYKLRRAGNDALPCAPDTPIY